MERYCCSRCPSSVVNGESSSYTPSRFLLVNNQHPDNHVLRGDFYFTLVAKSNQLLIVWNEQTTTSTPHVECSAPCKTRWFFFSYSNQLELIARPCSSTKRLWNQDAKKRKKIAREEGGKLMSGACNLCSFFIFLENWIVSAPSFGTFAPPWRQHTNAIKIMKFINGLVWGLHISWHWLRK